MTRQSQLPNERHLRASHLHEREGSHCRSTSCCRCDDESACASEVDGLARKIDAIAASDNNV